MENRREFLKQTAGVLASPFWVSEYSLESITLSEDFGDLAREMISDSIREIHSKYDLRDVPVEFINGRRLGKAYYGAAYFNLGQIMEIRDLDVYEFFFQKASKSKSDFIELFGQEAFDRYKGRNLVVLKDTETLQKDYPAGSFVICSRYVKRNTLELWYKLVAIHELGHILLMYRDLIRAYEALERIQKANESLMEQYLTLGKFVIPRAIRRHLGHVDCYSFNRFLKLRNSKQAATEEFVQILGFHVLGLPIDRKDEILGKKLRIVRNLMEEHYGNNRSIFGPSSH